MPGSPPAPAVVWTCVGLLTLVWGSTWYLIKIGLSDLPPLGSAAARFAVAALVMALLAPALARREGGTAPRPVVWITFGATNFAFSYAIVYLVEEHLPSGLVAVLWGTFPLMMAAAGHFFLPAERLTLRHIPGFLGAFAGLVVLFWQDLGEFGAAGIPLALLLLLSPLACALGTVVVKRLGQANSSVLLNRNAMALGAVLLGAAAAIAEPEAHWHWSGPAIGSLLYLAVIGTCVTFGLYYWLLRHLRARSLSLIAFVTPAIALAMGTVFGGEPFGWSTAVGTLLILGGVALAR